MKRKIVVDDADVIKVTSALETLLDSPRVVSYIEATKAELRDTIKRLEAALPEGEKVKE